MSWNVTLCIGAGLLAVGTVFIVRQHLWIRNAKTAPGTVVEMIHSRGSKGKTNYTPRVSFVADDGSEHQFVRGYSSSPPDFVEGEKVTVAYVLSNNDCRILTFGQRFGLATVAAMIGLSLMLTAAVFIIGGRLVPKIYLKPVVDPRTGQSW